MSRFDSTIKWLRKQKRNAENAARDLKSGQKIEFEGTDMTEHWIVRYENLVERYGRLIEAYEKRNWEP